MSQAALCKAVRDQMQSTFRLNPASCEVCFDGQPQSQVSGEFYIAVHPMGWTGMSADWDLHEELQVGVTLTMRTAFAPKDRVGIAVWLASKDSTGPDGMEARLRKAIIAVHQNQLLRIAANKYIAGGASGQLMTALYLLRVDPPKIQNWDWFGAAPPETEHATPICGVSQTIVFGKCQRCQSVPDMD